MICKTLLSPSHKSSKPEYPLAIIATQESKRVTLFSNPAHLYRVAQKKWDRLKQEL